MATTTTDAETGSETETGADGMGYTEYSQRRKDLKNKRRKEAGKALTNVLFPTGAGIEGRVVAAQIDALDSKWAGEEYDERRLRGDVPTPPSLGYRFHYWFYQLLVFCVCGWWTLGVANWLYRRRFRKKWPKDLRV